MVFTLCYNFAIFIKYESTNLVVKFVRVYFI